MLSVALNERCLEASWLAAAAVADDDDDGGAGCDEDVNGAALTTAAEAATAGTVCGRTVVNSA